MEDKEKDKVDYEKISGEYTVMKADLDADNNILGIISTSSFITSIIFMSLILLNIIFKIKGVYTHLTTDFVMSLTLLVLVIIFSVNSYLVTKSIKKALFTRYVDKIICDIIANTTIDKIKADYLLKPENFKIIFKTKDVKSSKEE